MNTCGKLGGSLTVSDCVPEFGAIRALFLTKNNTIFTETELADLKKAVSDKALNGSIFPLIGLKDIEPANEEANTQTYPGFNHTVQVAPGTIGYNLGFMTNSCLAIAFAKWNNTTARCFILDSYGNFWGTNNSDGSMSGISISIITNAGMFQTFKEAQMARFIINMGDATELPARLNSVEAGFFADEIVGQKALKLVKKSANSFAVVPSCGTNINSFFSLFKLDTADPTLWTAVNLATNQIIPISTVTPVEATETFTVTFTPAPVAGARVSLSIDLSESDVIGFSVPESLIFTA